jgi:Putative lumazine-binding
MSLKPIKMSRIVLLLTAFFCTVITTRAQTTEDSVKAAVNQLFTGMKNADATLVETAFADSAILQTIGQREGKTFIRNEKVKEFGDFIRTQKKDAADERIQFETVKIDGALAIVWTPYKFYYNGQFSHCGVNSFQLVRLNGQWKIQYLIDTRRKEPCE